MQLFTNFILRTLYSLALTTFAVPFITHGQTEQGAPENHNIDISSGKAVLHEPLLSVKGYSLQLSYSTNGVAKKATTRNLESGTSIVGLGWSIGSNKIVRHNKGTGATQDDSYHLSLNGGLNELVFTGQDSKENVKMYRIKSKVNWLVYYYSKPDQWKIIDDNGVTYFYGDGSLLTTMEHNATEHLVAWHNWMGSSVETGNQRQVSSAWNLAAIKDVVGQETTFYYDQVSEQVGPTGLKFTKASYLSSIIGQDGTTAKLVYEEKTPHEYVDPHQSHKGIQGNDQDAYQEQFETRYLRKVEHYNRYDELMNWTELDYSILCSENTNYSKRLLTKISHKKNEQSEIIPPLNFDYYGLNTQDGVGLNNLGEFTTINKSSGALYGALKSNTTSLGMTYIYQYESQEVEGSRREIDLEFPPVLGYLSYNGRNEQTHWYAPELFFGLDYVVALYEPIALDCHKTHLQVYEWIGDRWIIAVNELLDGTFHDYYKPHDYIEASDVDRFRNYVMKEISKMPVIGGVMNAVNDDIKDVVKGWGEIFSDLSHFDVKDAFKDFFNMHENIAKDIFNDLKYEFKKIEKEIGELSCHLGFSSNPNCDYDYLQSRLYTVLKNHRDTFSNKEYHITLQKDFFALHSSRGSQSIIFYQRDRHQAGVWKRNAEHLAVTSRFFSLASGDKFVSVLDEMTDGVYIYTTNGVTWSNSITWLDINNGKKIDFSQQSQIDPVAESHGRYRSTLTANNNLIVATLKSAKSSDPMKVFLIFHDEGLNWQVNSQIINLKRGLSNEGQGVYDAIFGFDGASDLKSGRSFAVLQCYNHLNPKIDNAINYIPQVAIIKTFFGSVIDDLSPDMRKVNSTYGITWNENYSNIKVDILHAGWGQTDVGVRIDGNVINKVGRAHNAALGSGGLLATNNGANFTFRYNGNFFVSNKFVSTYYATAFGPDISSVLNPTPNENSKETPKFYQYNPNIISSRHDANMSTLDGMLVRLKSEMSSVIPSNFITNQFLPALEEVNAPNNGAWSVIENASSERIPTDKKIRAIEKTTFDVVNVIVQVVALVIPGLGELDLIGEEAVESLEALNETAQTVQNNLMVMQSVVDALIDIYTTSNPFATSILQNNLMVNGKLFSRRPDESWVKVATPIYSSNEGRIIGTNNKMVQGFFPYSVANGSSITNKVALLKNGKVQNVITLDPNLYSNQVVHNDSLSSVSGLSAFVSYGPLDEDRIGFVKPNPHRMKYVTSGGPNHDAREIHAPYKDAQTVRLHRVTQENVTGALHDVVVRKVTINDGYDERYHYYHYENPQYIASTELSVYGKVVDIPAAKADSRLAGTSYKNFAPSGTITHYFYNRFNYATNKQLEGIPGELNRTNPETLIQFANFELPHKGFLKSLLGRAYHTVISDPSGKAIREVETNYELWEYNLKSASDPYFTLTIFPKRHITTVDGVSRVSENQFKEYPHNRFPILLASHSTFSTSPNWLTEKRTTERIYAFDLDTIFLHQNRLNAVASELEFVQQPMSANPIPVGCTATRFETVIVNNERHTIPVGSYIAKQNDDLAPGKIKNYAALAELNVGKQDLAIQNFETRLVGIERTLGNFQKAHLASISANKASVQSHNELKAVLDAVKLMKGEIPEAEKELTRITNEANLLTAQKISAEDNMRRIQANIARLNTDINDKKTRINTINTEMYNIQNHNWWNYILKVQDAENFGEAMKLLGAAIFDGLTTSNIEKIWDLTVRYNKLEKDKTDLVKKLDADEEELAGYRLEESSAQEKLTIAHKGLLHLRNEYAMVLEHEKAIKDEIEKVSGLAQTFLDELIKADDATKNATSHSSSSNDLTSELLNSNDTLNTHGHGVSRQLINANIKDVEAAKGSYQNLESTLHKSKLAQSGLLDSIKPGHANRFSNHLKNLTELHRHHDNMETHSAAYNNHVQNRPTGYASKWINAKTILSFDPMSASPVSWEDARNTISSVGLDKFHRNKLIHVKNANINDGEVIYAGFEPYEKNTVNLQGESSTEEAHSGSTSRLVKWTKKIRFSDFKPKPELRFADSVYVFSAWVKKRGWLRFSRLHTEDVTHKWKDSKRWHYVEQIIHKPDLSAGQIEISGRQVYIDDILLRPLDSEVDIYTYDKNDQLTSSQDNNGLTTRHVYDSKGQHIVSFDDEGKAGILNQTHFSRSNGTSFNPNEPNSTLSVSFQGSFSRFESDRKGRITLGKNDLSPDQEDFAFYFVQDTTGNSDFEMNVAGITILSINNRVTINDVQVFDEPHFSSNWLFIKSGGQFYCYLNGQLIHQLAARLEGGSSRKPLEIRSTSINTLYIGKQPVILQVFKDGFGRVIQSQHYNYENDLIVSKNVTGKLYNGWGLEQITTLPCTYDNTVLTYESNLIKSYNNETGELNGFLSVFYAGNQSEVYELKPEDIKYAYYDNTFLNDPLHRHVNSNPPGKIFKSGDQLRVSNTYYQDDKSVALIDSLFKAAGSDQFSSVRVVSPGQRESITIRNKKGEIVANRTGGALFTTDERTNSDGTHQQEFLQPNAHATTTSSSQNASGFTAIHQSYDLLGDEVFVSDPDQGQSTQFKNHTGLTTFGILKNSNELNQEVISMEYFKYDELGRPIEEGIYHAPFDRELMETMSNCSFWDDQGAESHNFWYYNQDENGRITNLHGRLSRSINIDEDYENESIYQYNIHGKVTEIKQLLKERKSDRILSNEKTEFTYFPDGKLKTIIYPNGLEVLYSYDQHGRMKTVGSANSPQQYAQYFYTTDGKVKKVIYGVNNYEENREYNLQGQLSELSFVRAGEIVYKVIYKHNDTQNASPYLMGRIAESIESGSLLESTRTRRFIYDNQYRLIEVEESTGGNNQSFRYSYDANGNMLSCHVPDRQQTFIYQNGRNVREYMSDSVGLITGINNSDSEISSITYDPFLKLPREIEKNNAHKFKYLYNTQKQRIAQVKEIEGQKKVTVYSQGLGALPLSEKTMDATRTATKNLIFGNNYAPICSQLDGDQLYFHLRDHLGSLRAAFNQNGATAAQYDYYPFGKTFQISGNPDNTFTYLYSGQEYESDLKIYNYRARLYSPDERQFLSTDNLYSDHSPYLFVSNDPVNYVDLDGEAKFDFTKINKSAQKKSWLKIQKDLDQMAQKPLARKDIKKLQVKHLKSIFKAPLNNENKLRFVATFNHHGAYKDHVNEALKQAKSSSKTFSDKFRPKTSRNVSGNYHEMLPVGMAVELHEREVTLESIQQFVIPTNDAAFMLMNDAGQTPYYHTGGIHYQNNGVAPKAHQELEDAIIRGHDEESVLRNVLGYAYGDAHYPQWFRPQHYQTRIHPRSIPHMEVPAGASRNWFFMR